VAGDAVTPEATTAKGARAATASEPGLRDYLGILRRRKIMLVVVVLVSVVVSVGAMKFQKQDYVATASLLLQPAGSVVFPDASAGSFGSNTAGKDPDSNLSTQIQILQSQPVQDAVAKTLGQPRQGVTTTARGQAPATGAADAPMPASFTVSFTPVTDTDILEVSAKSSDPKVAADVANAYVNAYLDFRRRQDVGGVLTATKEVQTKIDTLQRQLTDVNNKITAAVAANEQQVTAEFGGQQKALEDRLSAFQTKLDELQVNAALTSGGAQVIRNAQVPSAPAPLSTINAVAIGVGVGLVLGLGLAFLADFLDDSVKDEPDLERTLPGLPVLGQVPAFSKRRRVPFGPKVGLSRRYIGLGSQPALEPPGSVSAEAYRTLRTAVQMQGSQQSIFSVQVTSPDWSPDVAGVAANLALALSAGGQRVVVICANLRRPTLHEHFGLDNDEGLTAVLAGVPVVDALRRVPGHDCLQVLTSGPVPPNASELLGSAAMKDTLAALRDLAEIVVIDSAPILSVADPMVLSWFVDTSLLAVRLRETGRRRLQQSFDQLRYVDAGVLGMVLLGSSRRAERSGGS
jgi:capsular exopolysaccharide synthesis family protein